MARGIATIVNIGCDIAQQGIATPEDIDRAVTLGLGFIAIALWRGKIQEIFCRCSDCAVQKKNKLTLGENRRVAYIDFRTCIKS